MKVAKRREASLSKRVFTTFRTSKNAVRYDNSVFASVAFFKVDGMHRTVCRARTQGGTLLSHPGGRLVHTTHPRGTLVAHSAPREYTYFKIHC